MCLCAVREQRARVETPGRRGERHQQAVGKIPRLLASGTPAWLLDGGSREMVVREQRLRRLAIGAAL